MKRGLLLLLTLLPGTAFAQSPLPEWAAKVKFGKPVFVTTASGERIDGTAGQITPDSLIVSTAGGLRTVPIREIARVQKRDPTWTGAVIGGVLGLAAGLQIKFDDNVCPQNTVECEREERLYGDAASLLGTHGMGRRRADQAPVDRLRC